MRTGGHREGHGEVLTAELYKNARIGFSASIAAEALSVQTYPNDSLGAVFHLPCAEGLYRGRHCVAEDTVARKTLCTVAEDTLHDFLTNAENFGIRGPVRYNTQL